MVLEKIFNREQLMSNEVVFRAVLAVLTVMLYYNRHLAHGRRPPRKRPLGGLETCVIVVPTLWTISLVLYVLGFEWFDYSVPLPLWLRWVGVVVMALCLPLSSLVYRKLGAHSSKSLEVQKNHRLVTDGAYRYVRHPVYATLILCAVGACLVTANLVVSAMAAAVALVLWLRIKKEETILVARFGDEYRAFMARTGALIPKLL